MTRKNAYKHEKIGTEPHFGNRPQNWTAVGRTFVTHAIFKSLELELKTIFVCEDPMGEMILLEHLVCQLLLY